MNLLGIGTNFLGIGSEVSFSFGNETINRSIPTQRIYIENHPFTTNQLISFNLNGNSTISISTSPSGSPFNLPSTLYAVNKSPNTIGIKTSLTSDEVFFRINGDDVDDYYFETNYKQKFGDVKKIKSLVSISTSHELSEGDKITLNVKPNLNVGIGTSNNIKLIYDEIFGKLLINPIRYENISYSLQNIGFSSVSNNPSLSEDIQYIFDNYNSLI